MLAEGSREYLESLRPTARRQDVELFHASPRDPVWDYVLTPEAAAAALEPTEGPLVLVGHSHIRWRSRFRTALSKAVSHPRGPRST